VAQVSGRFNIHIYDIEARTLRKRNNEIVRDFFAGTSLTDRDIIITALERKNYTGR
jgi:hypothetical protein